MRVWGKIERRRRARVVFPLEEGPERPRMVEVSIVGRDRGEDWGKRSWHSMSMVTLYQVLRMIVTVACSAGLYQPCNLRNPSGAGDKHLSG